MIDVIGTSFVGGEANTISNFPGAFSENKNYEINDLALKYFKNNLNFFNRLFSFSK